MNIRECAYKLLCESEKSSKYISLALDAYISSHELKGDDRSFLSVLVYGVTERKLSLDYIISAFSGKKISSLDKEVVMLLRLGMYQILYLDKIPDSAAVNESVRLASRYCARSKNFINAILRRLCREKDALPYPSDNLERLSVIHSLPLELCLHFKKDYPERYEEIISLANARPRLTLTVNTLKTTREALAEEIGESCEFCENSDKGLRLTSNFAISQFEALADGRCYVQDEASQIAASALDAREGDTVIDVCSCPGGKAFFAAISMNNQGRIYCFDLHKSKLSLIENEAKKLGIDILDISCHDSTCAREDLIGKADKVICDVPCSGLGVIAKKPEIRYKSLSDFSELDSIQKNILEASAKYVNLGGTLVYSTCTLRKAENEERVLEFIKNNTNFELTPFKVGNISAEKGFTTLFPSEKGSDGFFVAKLKRIL
ncbi:MAG: 16S rRNA (cytosine(967)-C(5))-methyltransferase RsmB [Ruminococcaceae bacterium]|nr:16S rRNA (cytosine(967)-C(5))-methyltransferase RsmB [Oscillospiraceae bacterium]